jgi:hypothetical protein
MDATGQDAPATHAEAISDQLDFLPPPVREVLHAAALLGGEFDVADLSVVTGRRAAALPPARAAGVLAEAGTRLAFRRPQHPHRPLPPAAPSERRMRDLNPRGGHQPQHDFQFERRRFTLDQLRSNSLVRHPDARWFRWLNRLELGRTASSPTSRRVIT